MLAKRFRINKQDIDLLFKQGESIRTPFAIIRIRRTNVPTPRFCILFSKNIKVNNVERNRIRRHIYGRIEKHLEDFKAHRDYGIMVTPKLLDGTKKKQAEATEKIIAYLIRTTHS